MEGSSCDYVFNNSELNRLKGRWFSPQYPSTYPKNSRCKFTFIGREDEYVRIVVEYLHLQKSDLICLNSPGAKTLIQDCSGIRFAVKIRLTTISFSDFLEVRDGLTKKDPVIGLLCGVTSFYEFRSTNSTLNVQFISRSLIPSQGFRASYFFEPIKSFAGRSAHNQTINNELDQTYPFHKAATTERTNELYEFSVPFDGTRGRSSFISYRKVKEQIR